MMDTIFTNEQGKTICAVYFCEVPEAATGCATIEELEEWITTLLTSHGRTSFVLPTITRTHGGHVRWQHVVNSRRSTTVSDVRRKITARLGWPTNDPRVTVVVHGGCGYQGSHDVNRATSRAGTTHRLRGDRQRLPGVIAL